MKKMISLVFIMMLGFGLYAQQNIILIIADDVSPDYFGFYPTSGDTAKAPNIRSLLSKGIRFDMAWASPVCSPTRAGIFTGRYPFRTGVGAVISNASSPQLDTAEMSIARLLKYHAPIKYNTGSAGKWHMHSMSPNKYLYPNIMGYDFYSGNFNGAITDYYQYPRITNGVLDTVYTYATTQTVDDALSWMDTMNTANPFFLWLAFNAPHSPYHLPPANLCDTNGLPGTTAHIQANPEKYFKAAIQAMDTEIGRLFQYLNAHNLMDSTNIIFIGDNGNGNQVAQIANPNKSKGTLYDYGVHVPMIISGPAVVNPGRVSQALVNTPDLFATLSELGGLNNWINYVPANKLPVDSKSLISIIKDQPVNTRTWIFTEQFNSPAIAADGKTIRDEDYHLIRFDNGNEEFYNQRIDTFENNNLLLTTMNATDISHYHFLCDSLSALVGSGSCLPLGLPSTVSPSLVEIYPNPAQDFIRIQKLSNDLVLSLELYSLSGSLHRHAFTSEMDLSGISPGYYLLKIKLGSGILIHRSLIKE
ncbi:MAG: sulfatase-like hydrolase/transferase [Chitinophagaceae bacterium]|nr:sulfatase-like hydrolase/transferase [Chitinophagaceae bacterium]